MNSKKIIAFMIIIKMPITPAFREIQVSNANSVYPKYTKSMTCDEFARNAKFNPFSVLDDYWFTFYFWAPSTRSMVVKFMSPTNKELEYLRSFLDRQVKDPIDWNTTVVLLQDLTDKQITLLFRRGEEINSPKYWMYHYLEIPENEELMEPIDVRIKQTADNKYIGLMQCQSDIVYAMSRKKDVPPQRLLQEAASKIGYRGLGGKSYLYQGHSWLPIPEMKEEHYWMSPRKRASTEAFDHLWD